MMYLNDTIAAKEVKAMNDNESATKMLKDILEMEHELRVGLEKLQSLIGCGPISDLNDGPVNTPGIPNLLIALDYLRSRYTYDLKLFGAIMCAVGVFEE